MGRYTRRVQISLTDEQFAQLSQLVEETHKSKSALIREAIETFYISSRQNQRQQRLTALANLTSLNAPVADWHEMEDEIIRGLSSL